MNATRILVAAVIALVSNDAAVSADAPPGASACTGCHAASAGVDAMRSLAGRTDIAEIMLAFQSGRRPATIMNRLARGFTEAEIRAIAAWYAAQTP